MRNRVPRMVAAMLFFATVAAFGQTQSEMSLSAGEAAKAADQELNVVYKQVMEALSDTQKELLKQSQLAWIKYRDLCAKSEGALYEGGSIQPMIEARCVAAVTKEKTERLRAMLPDEAAKAKAGLRTLAAQKAAFEKADAQLNKVYKDYLASGPLEVAKEAQRAWLAYRDLCAKAEESLYDGSSAKVAAMKCITELTTARTERLKQLFMESYP